MNLPDPADFARHAVHQACEKALRQADVAGVFPTPLDEILRVADLGEIIDISDIPADIRTAKPRLLTRILGATVFPSRTVFVDLSQSAGRQRWTTAHETVHGILPWHEAAARLDDHRRLFGDSAEELEIEANTGAAYLIFQGHRWIEETFDYRHSLDTPIALASRAGASLHPAIRYYVEHHIEPMALAITGRIRRRNGDVPIYVHAESAAWRDRYPPLETIVGPTLLLGGSPSGELARQAAQASGVITDHVHLNQLIHDDAPAIDGRFVMDVFDNQHNYFFLLRPKRRVELGRRVAARSRSA